jgi:predicted enzyme related to lactoylglutathione lyase
MLDPIEATKRLVDAFEHGDVATAERLIGAERVRRLREEYRWTVDDYITKDWHPVLATMTGSPRRVIDVIRVQQTGKAPDTWPVRLTIEGPAGRSYFTIASFDETGLGSFGIGEVCNGIGAICIHCPQERREEVARFYAALLDRPLKARPTRIDTGRLPGLAIGASGPDEPMPRWPDPRHPAQMHLDISVPDLPTAADALKRSGGSVLRDDGDHVVGADRVGHPFCLVAGDGDEVAMARLVIDCPDPDELAAFYAALLGPGPEQITLGFQRVSPYQAPRWGDPRAPQQYHFDIHFEDAPAAEQRIEELGAPRLAPLGGTCPVYADPAGHPFCLCGD